MKEILIEQSELKRVQSLNNGEECADLIPIRDKCQHFTIDAKIDDFDGSLVEFYEANLPEECMHGDIVTGAEKCLRSMEVYFVDCVLLDQTESSKKSTKRCLIQKDPSGSGYCCVPLEVTRKIKDPLKFYENAFNFGNYDEIDFSGIQIDTVMHQSVVQLFTGGKPVHPSRKCFYFFSYNEWDSTSDDFDSGRYVKLTPEIDESFLGEEPEKIRDPQILASANEMKTRYEEKFTKTFLGMREDAEVEVYGLTFFCPKNNEPNGGSMETLYFKRIESNDSEQIEAIVLGDNKECGDEEATTTVCEFRFTPKVLTEYGRYGGVKLWSIENTQISPGEEPHTYIICNSELFY